MRVPVFDPEGHRTSEIIEFNENIFGEKVKKELIHNVVVMYEARQRQGTHDTKTRHEVSGSGKKPWRQKGTGRARCGSFQSPLWKGGGIVFGPHPRDYGYSMPKEAKRKACDSAWLAKLRDKEVLVIKNFEFPNPETKKATQILKNMELKGKSLLIGISEYDLTLWKSVRNIPRLSLKTISEINSYHLLTHQKVLLSQKAFEALISKHGGEIKSLNRSELYPKK